MIDFTTNEFFSALLDPFHAATGLDQLKPSIQGLLPISTRSES
jgi:hypothetical protein